jgi:hypothetical protein
MSAGSGASNLGYGNITPLSNINGKYVNVDNSQYSGSFSSNEIPTTGLNGAKSNIDAAAGIVPGICLFKGGSINIKKKIKNITKHYKRMKFGSRKIKRIKHSLKRILSRKFGNKHLIKRKKKYSMKKRRQRGGYAQYQNNLPMTPSYQVAGVDLSSSQLGLANPPPITKLSNCVNCVDNYNHYPPGVGFPSKGH